MLFIEIKNTAQGRLAVNDSQLNDDISPETWVGYVNESYNKVVLDWQEAVPREAKVEYIDIDWPEGELTLELPASIKSAIIYQILQVTEEGIPVGTFPGYFETRNILRVPPGYSVLSFSLRFYFIPVAEKWDSIDNTGASPLLVPDRHCPLIVWETLILTKSIMDKAVPQMWEKAADKARFSFFKENMSRPQANRAVIRLPNAPILRPLV